MKKASSSAGKAAAMTTRRAMSMNNNATNRLRNTNTANNPIKSIAAATSTSTGTIMSNNDDVNIPDKVMNIASSYIFSIRLKIATSLTSSLPQNDREHLLTSFGMPSKSNSQTEQQQQKNQQVDEAEEPAIVKLSIGEAVAEAIAKEASKHDSIMEKERIKIFQQAEKAALQRVQNDLLLRERKLALQRWEKELEEEKRREKENESEMMEEKEEAQQEQEKLVPMQAKEKEADYNDHHHPILGQVLMDFGYKRLHVASAKKLSAIPIWEKQRVYRHDRAKVMANDKMKTLELGLPGVVALHETPDGTLSIIDGQHRVGMLTILESKKSVSGGKKQVNNAQLNLDQILVEVFPQKSSSSSTHAKDLFTEINKAEPVKLVDMPGVAPTKDRRIIDDAAMSLQDKYPEMFKPSQRCRPPHLNIDNLRDAIFASGVLKKYDLKNKTSLLKWMQEMNDIMAKKYEMGGGDVIFDGNKNALLKAKKFGFYLGLDLSWLHS